MFCLLAGSTARSPTWIGTRGGTLMTGSTHPSPLTSALLWRRSWRSGTGHAALGEDGFPWRCETMWVLVARPGVFFFFLFFFFRPRFVVWTHTSPSLPFHQSGGPDERTVFGGKVLRVACVHRVCL